MKKKEKKEDLWAIKKAFGGVSRKVDREIDLTLERTCPGCGLLINVQANDTVAIQSQRGGESKGLLYFCSEWCKKKYQNEMDEVEDDIGFGDMLDDGFELLSNEDSDDY